jgi:hypothetical protein
MVTVGWIMLVAAVATPLAMLDDGVVGFVFTMLLALTLVLFVVGVIVGASIAAFGRPRRLVPPHLRGRASP